MGNMDTPLHAHDAQERAEAQAEALTDMGLTFLVAALFFRSGITYEDIDAEGDGWKVRVPPQKGIEGRTKKLYAEMRDGARFSVRHGTDDRGEYYALVRRK